MTDSYAAVAETLAGAGFRETEPGCFTSAHSPRVVGLAVCPPEAEAWRRKTEELLRKEAMRLAMGWARYVAIIVESPKTSVLAWAAAAFAQDVAQCRRIVLFVPDASSAVTLPFVGLPTSGRAVEAKPRDVDGVVQAALPPGLVSAFLNEDVPTSKVQGIAEDEQ